MSLRYYTQEQYKRMNALGIGLTPTVHKYLMEETGLRQRGKDGDIVIKETHMHGNTHFEEFVASCLVILLGKSSEARPTGWTFKTPPTPRFMMDEEESLRMQAEDPGIILIGTGGGMFDEHKSNEEGGRLNLLSSCVLIADHLDVLLTYLPQLAEVNRADTKSGQQTWEAGQGCKNILFYGPGDVHTRHRMAFYYSAFAFSTAIGKRIKFPFKPIFRIEKPQHLNPRKTVHTIAVPYSDKPDTYEGLGVIGCYGFNHYVFKSNPHVKFVEDEAELYRLFGADSDTKSKYSDHLLMPDAPDLSEEFNTLGMEPCSIRSVIRDEWIARSKKFREEYKKVKGSKKKKKALKEKQAAQTKAYQTIMDEDNWLEVATDKHGDILTKDGILPFGFKKGRFGTKDLGDHETFAQKVAAEIKCADRVDMKYSLQELAKLKKRESKLFEPPAIIARAMNDEKLGSKEERALMCAAFMNILSLAVRAGSYEMKVLCAPHFEEHGSIEEIGEMKIAIVDKNPYRKMNAYLRVDRGVDIVVQRKRKQRPDGSISEGGVNIFPSTPPDNPKKALRAKAGVVAILKALATAEWEKNGCDQKQIREYMKEFDRLVRNGRSFSIPGLPHWFVHIEAGAGHNGSDTHELVTPTILTFAEIKNASILAIQHMPMAA